MNVILTSNIIIDGRFFKAGKAVELSESDAKALIDNKLAYSDAPKVEEVKPTVAPKATPKKTTSEKVAK